MSGFEYEVAAILLYYGYYDEAVRVVKAVRDRYNGKNRNPWNDVECGHNYIRSMAAFSLIPVMSGFVADLPNHTLTFNPIIKDKEFNSIWSVASCWGSVSLNDNEFIVTINKGKLTLEKLILPFVKSVIGVNIDGKDIKNTSFENSILNFKKIEITSKIIISFK